MFKKVDPKQSFPKLEEEVLKFWEENKIFEKSLKKNKGKKPYVFYDGPPFATGSPHYGHIVASTMKDVVPRYWTMRGRYVERVWGWDCHGLPIENIAEKELGIKRKTEIEEMGIAKFNEFCRSKVLEYVEEWKKTIRRLGRWADMENAYKTMDLPYMESVWWVFKELRKKGLIYEGYRSMHICTRCETTLSQQEVSEGYKDIKDLSVIAKFELEDEPGTYVLAWTTTPWTLIGNVALAVGENIDYIKIEIKKDGQEIGSYIMEKTYSDNMLPKIIDKPGEKITWTGHEVVKGRDLIGKKYKPLFDYYVNKGLDNEENGWKIYPADFVTTEEGTGIVHIAPAFGEDDLNLSYKYKLPFIQHVGMDGHIKKEAVDFAGLSVKPMEDHQKTDVEIIKFLAKNNLLFAKEKYSHSYPHCWRCETPLINYATSSWFVNVSKIKDKAIELAKDISWSPAHIKEGRFGNWLEGARDWSISRQRFWASVIPIWKCHNDQQLTTNNSQPGCNNLKVIGSVKELEELSGKKITDLHKHIVDDITFPCDKCNGVMHRIPDVLDTWFDSASMPYAQIHYPFENKEKFEKGFPAQFIAEGVDQTRAWFYYLHLISNAIKNSRAYNNVIVNGIVLAEDGKKMSKRLKNYPDPDEIMEKYGADALRFYLLSSPVMAAENLNFKESEVAELVRGMLRMLWNSYSFFVMYANIDKFNPATSYKLQAKSLLDRWIISELHVLIKDVNESMEKYELNRAVRYFPKFLDSLSNWYIRRSRRRFWKSENDEDKNEAYQTLYTVLVELSKLMAPFAPFMAEEIYRNLTGEESVHLADYPTSINELIDEKLNSQMQNVRSVVNIGLEVRASEKIRVRQPLLFLETNYKDLKLFENIIIEELNVKKVKFVEHVSKSDKNIIVRNLNVYSEPDKVTAVIDVTKQIGINTKITEDLRLEGIAREIIRHIQEMRKEAGYEVDNRIKVGYNGHSEVFKKFGDLIAREVLANELNKNGIKNADLEKEFKIEGNKITITIKK
jgi:isoleucyl-tRNA synthetase